MTQEQRNDRSEQEMLLTYLKNNCVGEENATRSYFLEQKFGIGGQKLREYVNALRCSHEPVCSSSKGYFYASCDVEVRKTIKHMENRIKGIVNAIEGLRGVPMGDA